MQTPTESPQEQKPERVDELDVIGNALMKLFQKIFFAIKHLIGSKQ